MEKRLQQAGWWSLLLAGLAGAAYLPTTRTAAPSSSEGGSKAASTPVAATDPARDAQPTDALALIAQYFGTDVSEAGLRRRLLLAASRYASKDTASSPAPACPSATESWAQPAPIARRDACQDGELLERFFALDITPRAPGLEDARRAFKDLDACLRNGNLQSCRTSDQRLHHATVTAFLRQYFDDEALRVSNPDLVARHVATDFARLRHAELAQIEVAHAARTHGTTLAFLVATVPDGLDSFAGWSFDPATDAIRRAAERSGYVMDRFFVPDWSSRPSSAATSSRLHEDQPGIMIFRRTSAEPRPRILAVLLALETPTAGIHSIALDRALRLAAWWGGPGAYPELRVLGPFYSGSAPSLAMALRRLMPSLSGEANRRRVTDVRVISGSATSRANKSIIEAAVESGAVDQPKVEFVATTLPDNRCALRNHLRDAWGIDDMAWLRESNTAYGSPTQTKVESCPALDRDLEFLFPLHISRLRDVAGAPDAAPTVPATTPVMPLVLKEAFTPTDAFPSLSPALTSSAVEMQMRNIGRLLARQRIRLVGIIATDARDKLFLARAVRQMHPSATFVTTEANLLYSHPDYSDSMRGMLVASSFPLATSVTDSLNPSRVTFSSSAAEGIYNAALVQINDLPTAAEPGRAAELYGREFRTTAGDVQPSVWYSLVGREDTWPIERPPQSPDPYTLSVPNRRATSLQRMGMYRMHPLIVVIYIAFTVVAALHITAFVAGWPRAMSRLAGPGAKRAHFRALDSAKLEVAKAHTTSIKRRTREIGVLGRKTKSERYRRQLACLGSVLAVYGVCLALLTIWLYAVEGNMALLIRIVNVVSWTVTLGLFAIWIAVLMLLVLVQPRARHERSAHWLQRGTYSTIVLVISGGCAVACVAYVVGLAQVADPQSAAILVERYARLGNGLSPLLPVMFLATAVYVWAWLGLGTPEVPLQTRFDDGLSILHALGRAKTADLDRRRIVIVRARLVAELGIAGLGVWILVGNPLFTFEGAAFNWLFASAVLLIHSLIIPALVSVWWRWAALEDGLDAVDREQQHFVRLLTPTLSIGPAVGAAAGAGGGNAVMELPALLPSQLFKAPRLSDIEPLIHEYKVAVQHRPDLVRQVAVRLIEDAMESVERPLTERWKKAAADMSSAGTDESPIRVFASVALADHKTAVRLMKAVQQVKGAVVSSTASSLGYSNAMIVSAEVPEAVPVARDGLKGSHSDTTVYELLGWMAAQPEASRILSTSRDAHASPEFVKRLVDNDRRSHHKEAPIATTQTWRALTLIAMAAVRTDYGRTQLNTTTPHRAFGRFVALHLFVSVRQALWRIWRTLAFVMAAILLVTLSHLVYPMQPRSLLLGIAAGEVLVAVLFAMRATFAIEGKAILSRMTGTTIGQVNWSWGLVRRIVGWVILPIAGIFATRFGEVGDVVLKLFSPLEPFLR